MNVSPWSNPPASPRWAVWAGATALLLGGSSWAAAQTPGRALPSAAEIKKLAGTMVAESVSPVPETPMAIRGYRVERKALAQAVPARIGGKTVEVAQAWHVTVLFARPLTVRNQAFSLVVDGVWCGFLQEAPDLRSADTVCFDSGLFKEGAAIGVTYRGITIEPEPAEPAVNPEVALEAEGETPIHYASTRLRLGTVR
jgi:hypothetical protein